MEPVPTITITLKIEKVPFKTMVDSGSMVTVISERALRKLEKRPMHPCTVRINNFSHNPIETVGVTNITLFSNSNHPITVTVVVVPEHCMEEDMVLGIDCLSKRPFFLDYKRDVFLWNNISYPMKKSGPSEMCNIKVSLSNLIPLQYQSYQKILD